MQGRRSKFTRTLPWALYTAIFIKIILKRTVVIHMYYQMLNPRFFAYRRY